MSTEIGMVVCGNLSTANSIAVTQCSHGTQITLGGSYGYFNERKIKRLIKLLQQSIKNHSGCDTEEHY